jgi:transposase
MKFLPYNPDQAYLLPPSVEEVLSEDHLCFFLRRLVSKLDLSEFEQGYEEEGRPAYHPALLVSVWLYAYALGIRSSRRLEQRVREDLGFRYLAGGVQPDYWTLNEFRRRHPKGLDDLFTQVVELAREAGLGRLGHVAIDSTRVKANASPNRTDSVEKLRAERLRVRRQIRRWQLAWAPEDPNETPGLELRTEEDRRLEEKLAGIPGRLEQLKKSGLKRRSVSDPQSRFLKERRGYVLGYTVTMAASEDHLIVEQRVSQKATDNGLLVPVVEAVRQRCGERPGQVSADSGFFVLEDLKVLAQQKIDAYVPDSNLARVLNRGGRLRCRATDPVHRQMRRKLRGPAGRAIYGRRKALIEPVFGALKEQRGLRQFRRRGLEKAAVEVAHAALLLQHSEDRLDHRLAPLVDRPPGRAAQAPAHASLLGRKITEHRVLPTVFTAPANPPGSGTSQKADIRHYDILSTPMFGFFDNLLAGFTSLLRRRGQSPDRQADSFRNPQWTKSDRFVLGLLSRHPHSGLFEDFHRLRPPATSYLQVLQENSYRRRLHSLVPKILSGTRANLITCPARTSQSRGKSQ